MARWNYGNVLRYGLSMLNWEKIYGNTCGDTCRNTLKLVTRFIMVYPSL